MGVKRKQPDESETSAPTEEKHGSTIFVSNLPYNATSTDLQTLFSDYAPVRQAFVVLDKESKASKGVGYVSLAIKEDAERLVKELSETAPLLQGRKLRVQWPGSKPETEKKSDVPPQPKAKKPRRDSAPRPSLPNDPNAIRTIVLSGLPPDLDSKPIWKKARKFAGAEKVEFPVLGADGQAIPGTAYVVYGTHEQASAAVQGLHAHVFKGSLLSAVLKKRLDTAVKGSSAPSRASRLIVRNIPFHATENDLRSVFLPYGPIHSIQLPMEAPSEEHPKPRLRGFAFVWMLTKTEAEKAIAGVNGQVVGKRDGLEGRVVAVDWALSKDKWKEVEDAQKQEDAREEQEVEEVVEDDDDEDEADVAEADSDSEDFDHLGREGDDTSEEEDDDNEEGYDDADDDEDRPNDTAPVGRPALPSTDVGTTLFVRNIPFEATEEELRTTFRAFGPLRYAKITMDPDLGRSRGTGFVCFWNKEHADQAIADAELLHAETGVSTMPERKGKANPFTVHSILMPDPSSSLASRLVLQGRTLSVTRAVPRDEALKLKDEGLKKREKQDKRNVYLMREGVIFPNTPAADTIPSAELDRRMASFNTRRALLRTNPSLYISKTRLSVRQMPTFATDRTLKRLALYATREFEKEVSQGLRSGLTEDEKSAVVADDLKEPPKKKRGERPTAVIQSKIVRQNERVDPLTGKGKSKGYGFLEMRTHADALRVLRWANNNPSAIGLMSEWWNSELEESLKKVELELKAEKDKDKREVLSDRVKRMKARLKPSDSGATKEGKAEKTAKALILEFSIENVQVVRRRRDREVAGPEKREKRKARDEEDTAGGSTGPPSKRRRLGKDEKDKGRHRERPGSAPSRGLKTSKRADVSRPSSTPSLNASPVKNVGAVIGRKRKERKNKKA